MIREITLAFETAVGGGSISLLEKNIEIDFWIGNAEISRAEDLLSGISELFVKNNLEKSDLKNIIYSLGPGSYTGIRIGLATVKGLANALGCNCFGQTILEALTLRTETEGKVQTAVESAKNQISRQIFEIKKGEFLKSLSVPETVSNERFLAETDDSIVTVLLCKNREMFEIADKHRKSKNLLSKKIIRVGTDENIARLIGIFSERYMQKGNGSWVYRYEGNNKN